MPKVWTDWADGDWVPGYDLSDRTQWQKLADNDCAAFTHVFHLDMPWKNGIYSTPGVYTSIWTWDQIFPNHARVLRVPLMLWSNGAGVTMSVRLAIGASYSDVQTATNQGILRTFTFSDCTAWRNSIQQIAVETAFTGAPLSSTVDNDSSLSSPRPLIAARFEYD